MMNRFALGPAWFNALSSRELQTEPVALLRSLGYTGLRFPIC